MFSGFFGKGDKGAKPPAKDAGHSRGLEVIEDDQDTAWSLWDSVLAEHESRFHADGPESKSPFAPAETEAPVPTLDFDVGNLPTQPMPLDEMTPEQRKNAALRIVEAHHQRIAKTISTLWGYKECSQYINKLIMNGDDGMGHARSGFNQDAAEAMLVLADIHDTLYGANLDPSIDFHMAARGTGWRKLG